MATPRYVNLLKSTKKTAVQISLISLNENLINSLESRDGTRNPSANSRLNALRKLTEAGIFTVCRIQPMIPEVTESDARDLIFALAENGVNHVIVEFFWLPIGHAEDMSARLKLSLDEYMNLGGSIGASLRGYDNDLYSFYRSFPDHSRGYGRVFFSQRQISIRMPRLAQIVVDANKTYNTRMTFGSGNEETSYLNSTNNCCGVDRIEGFAKGTHCTVQAMMKIVKEKAKVSFDDFKECYNPRMDQIKVLWNKKENSRYFLEDRVFKLRSSPVGSDQVEYRYDESAVPS